MNVYTYRAALYCGDCADDIIGKLEGFGVVPVEDSEVWPQGPYPDGGGESDSPAHCDTCGEHLENPLTDDGRTY